jgi:rod shape-determining protein MreC
VFPTLRALPQRNVILRRRLTLAAFVAVVIVGLAVAGGPAKDVRRGLSTITSPIGSGISTAVKPFSNLTGWIGDTVTAKGDLGDARKDRDAWRTRAIDAQAMTAENRQLTGLYNMDRELALGANRPLTARVTVRSPFDWYEHIGISKGSIDGVRSGMPVVAASGDGNDQQGLIGKVSQVTEDTAIVQLLTNRATIVGAKIAGSGPEGSVSRRLNGKPTDLVIDGIDPRTAIDHGSLVVTQGTMSARSDLDSLYPKDLPIGRIGAIDQAGDNDQVTHVTPFVNSRALRYVQVLTRVVNHNR